MGFFAFIEGATSYAEVGEFVTKHNGDFAVNPTAAKFFDYEAFGKHISELYHGEFVGDGFIYNDTDISSETRKISPDCPLKSVMRATCPCFLKRQLFQPI